MSQELADKIRQTRQEIRLLESESRLQMLQRRKKRVQESNYMFDWVSGYQDLLDRLRSPDGAMLTAVSVAADRQYGANWPFWRTWQDHAFLRGSARVLATTNNQAIGALGGLTSYVIGHGYKWEVRPKDDRDCPPNLIKAVQHAVDEFVTNNDWNELEQEIFSRTRRDGESFVRLFTDDYGQTDIRICEPEQIVENPAEYPIEVGSFGIINSPGDVQKHVGYIYSPNGSPASAETVSKEDLFHIRINVDRNIKRGLTDFCFDTYDLTKSAGRLIGNMAEGSAIQASIALIRQHEVATPSQVQGFVDAEADFQTPDLFTGNNLDVKRSLKGSTLDIGKGFNYIQPPYSAGASSHVEVAGLVMRAVAAKWNAPEWLISGDSSNNNYASSLTAESPFVKTCLKFQRFYGRKFTAIIMQAIKNQADMDCLIYQGETFTWYQVKTFVELGFTAPTVETRNKLEEAQCYSIEVQNKVTSPQIWSAKIGNKWEQVSADLDEFQDRFGTDTTLPIPGEDEGLIK